MALANWQFHAWPQIYFVPNFVIDRWAHPLRETFDFPFLRDQPPTLAREEFKPLSELMSADLIENDKEYLVHCEAPGIENLNIAVVDGYLSISGERKVFHETKNDLIQAIEKSFAKTSKQITLPANADIEKVQSQYKDGVVHVSIPKKEDVGLKKNPTDT